MFRVIESSIIDDFHHHINSISPNIKFTLEWEDSSSLVFLDVWVNRTANCKLWTTIYHKPTHTDRYLQFDSHYPLYQKLVVARTLHHRLDSHIENHLNVNLILISPRKHELSMVSLLIYPSLFSE